MLLVISLSFLVKVTQIYFFECNKHIVLVFAYKYNVFFQYSQKCEQLLYGIFKSYSIFFSYTKTTANVPPHSPGETFHSVPL